MAGIFNLFGNGTVPDKGMNKFLKVTFLFSTNFSIKYRSTNNEKCRTI